MSSFLGPLLSFLLLYKYLALFAISYAAAFIVPLPVNATLLAIGAFSSQGYFSFWGSLSIAIIGSTLGDLTGYWIVRKYGYAAIKFLKLNRFGFFINLEKELRSDAVITVFMTRFAGSLSNIANFMAGLVGVPLSKFFIPDILGNAIEPFCALLLGYLAGDYWSDFSNLISVIADIMAVAVVIFVLWRIYHRITKKYS